MIGAAVAKGLEQGKLEREPVAARDVPMEPERSQPQQQANIVDQISHAFFERGERRIEGESQKLQSFGKYRELEELSRRDDPRDAVVSRQQREDSDRRQSIDPATRTENGHGRPPVAGEGNDMSYRAAKETKPLTGPRAAMNGRATIAAAKTTVEAGGAAERDELGYKIPLPFKIRVWQCPRVIGGQTCIDIAKKSNRVRQAGEPKHARAFVHSEKIVRQIIRPANLTPGFAAAH